MLRYLWIGLVYFFHVESAYLVDSEAYRNGSLGFYPNITYPTHPDVEFPVFQFDSEPTIDSSEYILLAPRGSNVTRPGGLILDSRGELVWDGTEYGETMAFSVQTYLGNQVLAIWVGEFFSGGYGRGNVLLLDQTYSVVANISTTLSDQGERLDFHEFQITPDDTALVLVYREREDIISGIVQEINITSSEAIFTWDSSDHIDPDDCFASRTAEPWDWIHLNSVEKDAEGNFLVSSRHCHAVYYIHPNGTVLWTLGGKNSSFSGTTFAWQHDARWHGDTISLFDNQASTWTTNGPVARGMSIELDMSTMTAKETAFDAPTGQVSPSQGNFQLQSDGHWIAGWGSEPYFTEFAANGTALWTAQFGLGGAVSSYRAVRANWTGYPSTNPSTEVRRGEVDTTVLISWSGATEVDYWLLLADNDHVGRTDHKAFEDTITVRNTALDGRTVLQVAAYSTNGSALGWSDRYILSDGTTQTATQTRTIGTATFAPQVTQTPVGDRASNENGATRVTGSWSMAVAILTIYMITILL